MSSEQIATSFRKIMVVSSVESPWLYWSMSGCNAWLRSSARASMRSPSLMRLRSEGSMSLELK